METRHLIALAAGVSPLILAVLLSWATMQAPTLLQGTELQAYLIQHRETISDHIIVSSLMVAVFCTILRSKIVTFIAGFQSAVTVAALAMPSLDAGMCLRFALVAIIVIPLLVLSLTLRRHDIDPSLDDGETD